MTNYTINRVIKEPEAPRALRTQAFGDAAYRENNKLYSGV